MSGQAGGRGYLIQALISVLDAITDDVAWTKMALEPNLASEKIDVIWHYPGRTKVVQTKSSQNQIAAPDVRGWANDLQASITADEYELRSIGPVSARVATMSAHGSVFIPTPQPLNLDGLVHQSAHKLDRYLSTWNLPSLTPRARELVVHALVAKLAGYATHGMLLERAQFDALLRKWITEITTDLSAGQLGESSPLEVTYNDKLHRSWADADNNSILCRLQVTNIHQSRTIEAVRIKIRAAGPLEDKIRLQKHTRSIEGVPLAVSGPNHLPFHPPTSKTNLPALDSVTFDFVRVCRFHGNYEVRIGEFVANAGPAGDERQYRTPSKKNFLPPGKYKATIEAQGKDVRPVQCTFEFWGTKNKLVFRQAGGAATEIHLSQINEPDVPEMLREHCHARPVSELRKPEYDGKSANRVSAVLTADETFCGLTTTRFITQAELETIPEKQRPLNVFIVSEETVKRFPTGLPGFPSKLKCQWFNRAWAEARG